MHVEPPESPLRSLKDFAIHYGMIVLSILTALALEQLVVGMEHAHEGRHAKDELEQEVADNRHNVEEALRLTRLNLQTWQALLEAANGSGKSPDGAPPAVAHTVDAALSHFSDALPPLKSAAWDAAVASHAVDYLDHADLERFSQTYATQRFFNEAMWGVLRDGALRNLSELTLMKLRGSEDARALVETLNWRVLTLQVLAADLDQLRVALGPEVPAPRP